jgi:hypothetical protein
MKKYTAKDAYSRISQARVGSLVDSRLTYEYLKKLREELLDWIDQIDKAFYKERTP